MKNDEFDSKWTFLTNHSHVLILLAQDPEKRIRDIAVEVGITERAVQRILSELIEADFLKVKKKGRRNNYIVANQKSLRHPIESHRHIRDLIDMIAGA